MLGCNYRLAKIQLTIDEQKNVWSYTAEIKVGLKPSSNV